jgi:exopolysaccharide production protein ExoZ
MNPSLTSGPAAPPSVRRLESVQILRGVAAMLVVFHHSGIFLTQAGHSYLIPSKAVAHLGAFGVDLFFIISGFVMALSASRFVGASGAGVFLSQRFIRIAPLFYLASLLMLAESLRAGLPIDPSSILNSITFIPIFDDATYSWPLHYLGWTLAFEFVFYLVVAALIAGGQGGRHSTLLLVTLMLPLAGFVFHLPAVLWKAITNPLIWEFSLGVLACILWEKHRLERLRLPFAAGLVAMIVAGAMMVWPDQLQTFSKNPVEGATTAARAFYYGLPAFLFFGLVVGAPAPGNGPIARSLKLLGDASYSIYLSHLFVVMFVREVIKHLPLNADVAVVTNIVMSALVGIAVYRLAEKPMLTAGQRRIRGWSLRHMRAAG